MAFERSNQSAGYTHCMHGKVLFVRDVTPSDLCTLVFCREMQRLTVPIVDRFIAELKDSVHEARNNPNGKGNMVVLYGERIEVWT